MVTVGSSRTASDMAQHEYDIAMAKLKAATAEAKSSTSTGVSYAPPGVWCDYVITLHDSDGVRRRWCRLVCAAAAYGVRSQEYKAAQKHQWAMQKTLMKQRKQATVDAYHGAHPMAAACASASEPRACHRCLQEST